MVSLLDRNIKSLLSAKAISLDSPKDVIMGMLSVANGQGIDTAIKFANGLIKTSSSGKTSLDFFGVGFSANKLLDELLQTKPGSPTISAPNPAALIQAKPTVANLPTNEGLRDTDPSKGYKDPNNTVYKMDVKYKCRFSVLLSRSGIAVRAMLDANDLKASWINEAGLYKLVLKSTLKSAAVFQDWVCMEVLPSIRKTGSYAVPPPAQPALVAKQIKLLNAYLDGELKAGCVLFIMPNVVHFQYSSGTNDRMDTAALDVLFDYVIQRFHSTHHVSFGNVSEQNGLKINQGLAYWKESFGCRLQEW